MKRTKSSNPRPPQRPDPNREPLADGTVIRDVRNGQSGVILDHACQYAHPKAAPVFNYLVRWEDGQVQALSEAALAGGQGYEVEPD